MQIYFNWLGEWKEINNEKDTIDNMIPSEFVAMKIRTYEPLRTLDNIAPKFIKIKKGNYYYYIQFSQLVWSEKISNYTNEERW